MIKRPYCKICLYEHKVRPLEFCRALNAKGGLNKNIDKDLFMVQLMEMHNNE